MPRHPASHRHRTLAALVSVLCSFQALAAPNDTQQTDGLRLFGGLGWTYDDNLLRVADGEQAFDGQRSDWYRTLDAGVVVNKTIGRQRLAATAKVSKVKFDHFNQLDYDGRDLQASWLWEVGNRFEGRAEALYVKTLAPYTDFDSDRDTHCAFSHGHGDLTAPGATAKLPARMLSFSPSAAAQFVSSLPPGLDRPPRG